METIELDNYQYLEPIGFGDDHYLEVKVYFLIKILKNRAPALLEQAMVWIKFEDIVI